MEKRNSAGCLLKTNKNLCLVLELLFIRRFLEGSQVNFSYERPVKIRSTTIPCFGRPVNIDEKFLDELKSALQSKIVPANSDVGSFEKFGGHPVMKKSSDGTGSKVLQ